MNARQEQLANQLLAIFQHMELENHKQFMVFIVSIYWILGLEESL